MNNKIILNECIQEFSEKNEFDFKDDEVMEIFSLTHITSELDPAYSEIEEAIVDGGADGGIDSFIIFINAKSVITDEQMNETKFNENTQVQVFISQAKIEKSFKESVIDKLYISLNFILDLELDENQLLERFNPRLVEKILLFRMVWKLSVRKKSNFDLNFTYSCKAEDVHINGAFQSKVDQLIQLTKDGINIGSVNYNFYSSKELIKLYSKPQHTELELIFKETPMPIQGSTPEEYGYIGVVSLREYYNFIVDREEDKIREYLFESNIRHYQGDTANVNEKIADTLKNDLSQDFWWLNNGITIIVSDCNPIHKTLCLDDVQIVNGLQTSYTIGKFYDPVDNEDTRSILVKVIKSKKKETIDNIIFATNSQNPISATLLRATGEIHRNLEVIFSNKGYYYDRRKNYYKNHGKPANKIFNIQDTAQAIEAILNFEPAKARSKPTTLIKTDSSYNRIFNEENIGSFLNCCLIHQKVRDYIKRIKLTKENMAVKNFTLHTSRILASILTSKSHYSSNDIKDLDIKECGEQELYHALKLLLDIILVYKNENPEDNIINIAKSNKFVASIEEGLSQHEFNE